jgi:hypothetical protein
MNDAWALARQVIEWMYANVPREATVLELGGGRGSKRISRHFRNTTTVEHDPVWVGFLLRQGVPTLHRPLVDGWYEADPLLIELLSEADVVVVDGPIGSLRNNIEPYLKHIKAGATVVFDDTHRAKTRALVRWPITHEIYSDRRRTTICKCTNDGTDTDKGKASTVDSKANGSSKRKRKQAVRKPKVEKVQKVVPDKKPVVRKVRKSSDGG